MNDETVFQLCKQAVAQVTADPASENKHIFM